MLAHVLQKGSGSTGCVAQAIAPDHEINSRLKYKWCRSSPKMTHSVNQKASDNIEKVLIAK